MNIEQTNQSVTSLWCPKCCNEFKGELLSSLRSLCIAKMTDFYPLCTVCEDLKSMWKRKKRASKERPSHHFQKLLALEAHCRHFGSGGFFCNWSRWCLTFFSIEKPQHQEQLCYQQFFKQKCTLEKNWKDFVHWRLASGTNNNPSKTSLIKLIFWHIAIQLAC